MRNHAERSIAMQRHVRFASRSFINAALPLLLAGTPLFFGISACGDGERTGAPLDTTARGALVSVDSGETVVGFTRGKTRATQQVSGFQISTHPVTKKQYRRCEEQKVCKRPDVEKCSDPKLAQGSLDGDDANAAICVGYENAKAYCAWAGGRLPTLAEWLRAARGQSVQQYPWGTSPASCAQYPRVANGQFRPSAAEPTDGCPRTAAEALATGKHPAGAAGSGMQDILIAPAELVVGDPRSPYRACDDGSPCLVYGINPGAIDSVAPYYMASKGWSGDGRGEQPSLAPMAYGFRCIVEK